MKRVLIVDDHALFRGGLRRLLEGEGIAQIVGEAGNGVEMLDMLATGLPDDAVEGTEGTAAGAEGAPTLPDVVLLDIDMPVMDGRQAAAAALARWPELRIITLSMHGDEHYYFAMVEAGVRGFLLKDSGIGEVAQAIEAVCAGSEYFSPELLAGMAGMLRSTGSAAACDPDSPDDPCNPDAAPQDDLSARELEVLLCVCEGLSNQEIADKLFISKRTVDKHRANIMLKTGNKNTAALVVYAIKQGLVSL